jgi:hypothetical protein
MPGIPINTNIAIDLTMGALTHNFLPPPPVPPPPKLVPVPSIEMVATQMWTLGFLAQQNKLTSTVFHKWSLPIVLEEHDIGMMIPDVTIPPVNLYYAIMWPFSSRKINFATSIVKMEKKMVGCSAVVPPLPMMTCGDPVTAITAFPLTNLFLDSIQVGIVPSDIILGVCSALFSMGIDLLFFGIKDLTGSAGFESIKQELLDKLLPTDKFDIAKKLLGGLSGLLFPPPGEKPSYKLGVGWPGLSEYELEIGESAGVAMRRKIGGRQAAEVGLGGEQGSRIVAGENHYLAGGPSAPAVPATPPTPARP